MLLIKANRDLLLKPLQSVTGVVERRHTLPILANVLIEKSGGSISFAATDLEIQITSSTPCEDDGQKVSVTVGAKKLQDILRSLPDNGNVSLETQDSRLQVKAGHSRFNLQTLPAEDFPRLAEGNALNGKLVINQKMLKGLLSLVQYAMAQQDIRYYLNGLLLVIEGNLLKVVATDGHRLAFASGTLDRQYEKQEVILPRKTVIELTKLLSDSDDALSLEILQNQIRFEFSGVTVISKLVDGKFPDYTKVIPVNYQQTMTMGRIPLLQALQRAAILSNEKIRGVRLVITEGNLRIICTNTEQEEAQEEFEIEYGGSPLDIGFNISYLLDVLTNLAEESVNCAFGDSNSSVLISIPGRDDFKYVVMPMRI